MKQKGHERENIIKNRKDELNELIMSKKEKRKLQFESKTENERRLAMMRNTYKSSIIERHQEKDRKINEMHEKWVSLNKSNILT